ncbi:MAG TPA: ribonuclease P protein component 4 [Methanothermococcus okinawensis]|uniref:Ribonuclease P protein component 4 n=1 Tax=Methanofervidicoccus abyssi TaxID=2082189 RepID=A0A401HQB9_9EURY|nr:ribonuclease P protein component 4 [Methanofervidicoccus abyssi]GBF36341.1 ribonuclease P protein subunit RPR2 [Methanofervidicoccus abyssi]HIP34837.1 ribonuclease P protein component 4 [Methanothermococcus okinawensis]
MGYSRRRKIKKIKKIALERIDILMNLAEEAYRKGRLDRMRRYIELSRRIAMKVRVHFPKKWKRRLCKKCLTILIYGENCKVRTVSDKNCPHVAIKCLNCGNVIKIPMVKEKKLKRRLKRMIKSSGSDTGSSKL